MATNSAFLSCSEADFKKALSPQQQQQQQSSVTFAQFALLKGFAAGQCLVVDSEVDTIVYNSKMEKSLCEAKVVMAVRRAIAQSNVPMVSDGSAALVANDNEEVADDGEDEEEIEEILSSVNFLTVAEFLDLPTVVAFHQKNVLFCTSGYGLINAGSLGSITEQLTTVGSRGVLQGLGTAQQQQSSSSSSSSLKPSNLVVVYTDATTLSMAQVKVVRFFDTAEDDDEEEEELSMKVLDDVTFVKEEDFVFSLSRALETAEAEAGQAALEGGDAMPPPCFDGEEEDDDNNEEGEEEEEEEEDENDDEGTAKGEQWEIDAEAMLEQYIEALLTDVLDATHWFNLGLALEQVTSDRKEELQQKKRNEEANGGEGEGPGDADADHAPAVTVNEEIGDVTEADCYVKALQYDALLSDAWYNLGRVLMGFATTTTTENEVASSSSVPRVTIPGIEAPVSEVECFRRAVETTKIDDGQCWCNLGDALFRHKVYQGVSVQGKVVTTLYNAQQCAIYALKKDTSNFVAWNNLGDTLFEATSSTFTSTADATECSYNKEVTVNGRTITSAQDCYLRSLGFEATLVDVWRNLRKTMTHGAVVSLPGSSGRKLKVADVDRTIKRLENEA